jgi:hypothetical protein
MGLLIIGGFLALAAGMGIGTLAARLFGFNDVIGQVAGVALVIAIGILLARAEERDRRTAQPPAGTVVTSPLAPAPALISGFAADDTFADNSFANDTFADDTFANKTNDTSANDTWETPEPSDASRADDSWNADEGTARVRTRGLASAFGD